LGRKTGAPMGAEDWCDDGAEDRCPFWGRKTGASLGPKIGPL